MIADGFNGFGGVTLGEAEQGYVARTCGRDVYKRAMDTCQATKGVGHRGVLPSMISLVFFTPPGAA
jgi:hypothetical protein